MGNDHRIAVPDKVNDTSGELEQLIALLRIFQAMKDYFAAM